jgi:dihydropteroate synthase
VAISVLAAQAGAWGVRVHDPVQSLDAIATVAAVQAARRAGGTRG